MSLRKVMMFCDICGISFIGIEEFTEHLNGDGECYEFYSQINPTTLLLKGLKENDN